jgi:hypothetical protein
VPEQDTPSLADGTNYQGKPVTEEAPESNGADRASKTRFDAVQKAADADPNGNAESIKGALTDREALDATEWFMSDEVEEEGYLDFEMNVGVKTPRWVTFRVQSIGRERIDEIRRQNTPELPDGTRRPQELAINTRIAAEGLISPDLKKPEMRMVRGQQYMDPADALAARFAHKPGLIDQLSAKVIDATGYNDDDVREVRAGKS